MSASQLLAIIIGVCQFLGIHQVLDDDSLISSTSSFLSILNMYLWPVGPDWTYLVSCVQSEAESTTDQHNQNDYTLVPMSSQKNKKHGQLGWILTNFTTGNLSVSKPNLIQCKKARISFQMGQEQIIQGMWYFTIGYCHSTSTYTLFNSCYSQSCRSHQWDPSWYSRGLYWYHVAQWSRWQLLGQPPGWIDGFLLWRAFKDCLRFASQDVSLHPDLIWPWGWCPSQ